MIHQDLQLAGEHVFRAIMEIKIDDHIVRLGTLAGSNSVDFLALDVGLDLPVVQVA